MTQPGSGGVNHSGEGTSAFRSEYVAIAHGSLTEPASSVEEDPYHGGVKGSLEQFPYQWIVPHFSHPQAEILEVSDA